MKLLTLISLAVAVALVHGQPFELSVPADGKTKVAEPRPIGGKTPVGKPDGTNHHGPTAPRPPPKTHSSLHLFNTPTIRKTSGGKPNAEGRQPKTPVSKPDGANHRGPATPQPPPKKDSELLLYSTLVSHKIPDEKPATGDRPPVSHKKPVGKSETVEHPGLTSPHPPAKASNELFLFSKPTTGKPKSGDHRPISHKTPVGKHDGAAHPGLKKPVTRKTPVGKPKTGDNRRPISHKTPISKPRGINKRVPTAPHLRPPTTGRRLHRRDEEVPDLERDVDVPFYDQDGGYDAPYVLAVVAAPVKQPPKSSGGHHPVGGSQKGPRHPASPPSSRGPHSNPSPAPRLGGGPKHAPPKTSPGHHPNLRPGVHHVPATNLLTKPQPAKGRRTPPPANVPKSGSDDTASPRPVQGHKGQQGQHGPSEEDAKDKKKKTEEAVNHGDSSTGNGGKNKARQKPTQKQKRAITSDDEVQGFDFGEEDEVDEPCLEKVYETNIYVYGDVDEDAFSQVVQTPMEVLDD
ncbi:hypothetical protein BGZ73_008658 [Actinomortierella ambigua]|nr:hypothetical protein BGZ73_008658 [Actinomortierella ambigua]